MNWKEEAIKLRKSGLDWFSVAIKIKEMFPDESISYEKVKRLGYKKKPKTPPKIKETVIQNLEPVQHDEKWTGNQIIKFGIVSDTHINSKYTQLTHLHDFYDICKSRGIKTVYHAGDISDGLKMRAGHEYELYEISADGQVEEIVKNYPYRKGIITKFITGNHDASTIKQCGYDIGKSIADKRKDMEYLGRDTAIINLTPNCKMQLLHPWDGGSYAISYRPQKILDAMEGGLKPNILVIGHHHKQLAFTYRNVFTLEAGCFQAQTPFMRGKALSAYMGGYIVEVEVDSEGTIKRFVPEFFPYFISNKEDYLRWR